jgi:hypothetical protein
MKSSNVVAFYETSAKTGENIEAVFHLIATACLVSSKRKE